METRVVAAAAAPGMETRVVAAAGGGAAGGRGVPVASSTAKRKAELREYRMCRRTLPRFSDGG